MNCWHKYRYFLVIGLFSVGSVFSTERFAPQVVSNEEQIAVVKKGVIEEQINFIENFWKNAQTVGAIAPSSEFLATSMTELLSLYKMPLRILEVGAGTGVFTQKIIEKMPKGSHCDVVELEPSFCEMYLRPQFGNRSDITIHSCSVLDAPLVGQYDFIVSGLPFNSLPIELVEQILNLYKKILKPMGILTYFEYAFLPTINQYFLYMTNGERYDDLCNKSLLLSDFKEAHKSQKDIVWFNLPPARVITNLGTDLQMAVN